MLSALAYWRLAVWKAASGSVLVVGGTCPAVILSWDSIGAKGQVVAIIGIGVAVIKFLDAFFDQTAARLAAGKPPVPLQDHGQDHKPQLNGILHKILTVLAVVLVAANAVLCAAAHD